MYSAGKIRGFLHLYVGEEAVAAGSLPQCWVPRTPVVATYREHAMPAAQHPDDQRSWPRCSAKRRLLGRARRVHAPGSTQSEGFTAAMPSSPAGFHWLPAWPSPTHNN